MSDAIRDLVLEGIAHGELDAAAIDRYDAAVKHFKEVIAPQLLNDRPLLSCVVEPRDKVPPGKLLCGKTWPLQECER